MHFAVSALIALAAAGATTLAEEKRDIWFLACTKPNYQGHCVNSTGTELNTCYVFPEWPVNATTHSFKSNDLVDTAFNNECNSNGWSLTYPYEMPNVTDTWKMTPPGSWSVAGSDD